MPSKSVSSSSSVETCVNNTRDKNCRRWTNAERTLFVEILVDNDNHFLLDIEKLASKSSSNEEIFAHIKVLFDDALRNKTFVKHNEKEHFTDRKGTLLRYEKLDTSVPKLRSQLKTLKKICRKKKREIKSELGLTVDHQPPWFVLLNPILTEIDNNISDTSCVLQTSVAVSNVKKTAEYDKMQESVEYDNIQGSAEYDIIQQSVEYGNIQESAEYENIQQSAECDNIQQSAECDNIQESVEYGNIQESIEYDNIQESAECDNIQESVEYGNIQESIEYDNIQESAEYENIQHSAEDDNIQESVEYDNIQESSECENIQQSAEDDNTQESVEYDNMQESVEYENIQHSAEDDNMQESVEYESLKKNKRLLPHKDESSNEKDRRLDLENLGRKKMFFAGPKKRQRVHSNEQTLSELALSMKNLAESQMKRTKMMIEAEDRREERRRKERLEEAERNRKHELEIAKIYATAFASMYQSPVQNHQVSVHGTPLTPISSHAITPSPRTPPSPSTSRCTFIKELQDENFSRNDYDVAS